MSKRNLSLKDYRRLKTWAHEAIRICNEADRGDRGFACKDWI